MGHKDSIKLYTRNEFEDFLGNANKMFYVYGLYTPDGTPFYVGKGTINAKYPSQNRVFDHLYMAHSRHSRHIELSKFINKIEKTGIKFACFLLTNKENIALMVEQLVIEQIGRRLYGGTLYNRTNGGEGFYGYKPTAITLERQRISRIGRKFTDAHRKNISIGHKNSRLSKLAAERRQKPVIVNKVVYDSITKAATALGISKQVVRYRISSPTFDYAYARMQP